IGLETRAPVRRTRAARWLRYRPIRFPFLAWQRVINPFDLTGFGSTPDYLIRHVIGAHHAGDDAIYDMTLLRAHEGALDTLRARINAVIEGRTARDRFLRDLCVYEGYHEHLLEVLDAAERGVDAPTDARLPTDTSLPAFVAWCLDQPPTLRDALRARRLRLDPR